MVKAGDEMSGTWDGGDSDGWDDGWVDGIDEGEGFELHLLSGPHPDPEEELDRHLRETDDSRFWDTQGRS